MKLILLYTTLLICACFNPAYAEDDFLLWYHDGGKRINHQDLNETIENVVKTLPAGQIPGMRDLVRETLMIETHSGEYSYTYAAENWNNYGIAQIREDTAKWLLDLLYKRDLTAFSEVYKYYDPETSLKRNLMVNVPFSIAVCAQLYAHRLKGFKIDTQYNRALAWKRFYNTPKGLGTVQGYINRVRKFS